MTRIPRAALLVLLFLSGCTAPFPYFTVSDAFTADQVECILEGVEMVFEAVPEARVPVYLVSSDDPGGYIIRPATCSKNGRGAVTDWFPRQIRLCGGLRYDSPADECAAIRNRVAHEVIHARTGTRDHLPPGNIMSPELVVRDSGLRVTEADAAFIRDRL